MTGKQIIRLILFGLIVGGAIYWLADLQLKSDSDKVIGTQVQLPAVVDQQLDRFKSEIMPKSVEIIEETELAQEVEDKINQAMGEVKGFSEDQRKEIKKQIIRQVADQLIKQIEENE